MSYNINFTDKNKLPIQVDDASIDNSIDVSLFGRTKLEYGRDLNANLLHILENFACEENYSSPGTPDLTSTSTIAETSKRLLSTPTEGQMWWNKTQKCMFVWGGTSWKAMSMKGEIAVNWGAICDGEQIPRPQASNGYIFEYEECAWIVSPKYTIGEFDYMVCYTDELANVTMQYGIPGGIRQGIASYMIVGIKGNYNLGVTAPITPPLPSPSSVTPTPTVTSTVTGTPMVTPTVTPTQTPAPGSTPTPEPTPSITPSVTRTPASTPPVTVSATPPVTPTVTPSPSPYFSDLASASGLPHVLHAVSAPMPAWAAININANGTWDAQERNTTSNGTWLNATNGNDYEMYYTFMDSSSSPDVVGDPGPGELTWLDFPVSFTVYDSSPATFANVSINYTIRKKSRPSDSISGSLIMNADGGCFAYGTMIKTPSGYCKIEDLNAGDEVVSFMVDGMIDESEENWKDWTITSIKSLASTTSKVVAAASFTREKAIKINGITSTLDHVYFIYRSNQYMWVNASEIVDTDKLVSLSGRKQSITSIEVLDNKTSFVALNVENVDTLVVKSSSVDILAHNASA